MAVVIGPLHSLDARGALGTSLIFAKQRGSNYTKAYAIPQNDNTPAQQLQRLAISAITKGWQHVSDANRLTWTALALTQNTSPYHAYLRDNTHRWRAGLPPRSKATNPQVYADEGAYLDITDRRPEWDIYLDVYGQANPLWAAQLVADTFDLPPTEKSYTVALPLPIENELGEAYLRYTWTAPDLQFYYFRLRVANETGEPSQWYEQGA